MYIITILQERCLRELEDELEEELEDEWEVDHELITQLITQRLSNFEDILPPQGAKPLDPTRCHARIWADKTGAQCSHKIKDECLCKKHFNELCTKGYLRFNQYDEERPIINEDGNPIPWNDGIVSIDTIFRYQRMNLHKLLKQRKITPQ